MVQTRSQTRSQVQQPQNEESIGKQQNVLNNKKKVIDNFVMLNTKLPYESQDTLKNDILSANKMESSRNKTEFVYCMFQKIFKSTDLEAMKNTQFVAMISKKLIEFSRTEYTKFSEFLLPMLQHVHSLCNHHMKHVFPMDSFYMNDYKNVNANNLEDVIVTHFCLSDVTDTFYINIVDSLYVKGKISVSRFEKFVNPMLQKLTKYHSL